MFASKLSGLIGALTLSTSAAAFSVCGFEIPENEVIRLHREETCSASVQDKTNYAGLDYLAFYDHRGIDKLLSDDIFFIQEDGANYFVSEEVDNPKVTIKAKHQDAAKSISFDGMTGYITEVEYFVHVLPEWKDKKNGGYSMNISCMLLAAGNQQKAFKTRFCVPQTTAGSKQMIAYKSLIEKIQPQ